MKIGLLYASDYGYSASPENWTFLLCYSSNGNGYNSPTNTENNWIYSGEVEWLISPSVETTYVVFLIDAVGNVGSARATNMNSIWPSFYLNANVALESGSGTQNDPYYIF